MDKQGMIVKSRVKEPKIRDVNKNDVKSSADVVSQNYGVLLLAYGNPCYLKAAKVLRQCLKIHSPNIPCALATDQYKKQDLKHYFEYVIPIKNRRLGYLEKVYINTYSPFERTLYLDANSLIFKDISKIFTSFKGNSFTFISNNLRSINDPLRSQHNRTKLDACMKYYKIEQIHQFSGTLYYFENDPKSAVFFKQAQSIATPPHPRTTPTINDDQAIYGIAHELTQIVVICLDKNIRKTVVGVTDEKICILKGECAILKNGQWRNSMILCPSSCILRSFNFFHFLYLREELKLKFNKNLVNFLYTSKLIILFAPWTDVITHYLKASLKFILGPKGVKKVKKYFSSQP